MGCGGDDRVVSDAVDATTASELIQLEAALDGMDKAMASTMKSFNELISSIDRVGHIYSNISVVCDDKVKERTKVFDVETRAMQEKGLYPSFNADVISGSITVFDTMKKETKIARGSLDRAKKLQAEYESRRAKVEAKEADYAKKGKQIMTDKDYQKNLKERDQKKALYEAEKGKFNVQMQAIRSKVNETVIKSSTNYANCVIAYFHYMGKVVLPFTDPKTKPPKLSALGSAYKVPVFSTQQTNVPDANLLVGAAPVASKDLAPGLNFADPKPAPEGVPGSKAAPAAGANSKAAPAAGAGSKAPPAADAGSKPPPAADAGAKSAADSKAPSGASADSKPSPLSSPTS